MGVMPVGPLLANISIPIIISMLVQAMYNVVDSIFVARLGEDALAAVGLIFPVQNLLIAVAVGTGVGINALLSRRLGEKNVDSANRVAVNGIFLSFVSWAVFALLSLFLTEPFVGAFAKNAGPDLMAWAKQYMYIVTIGSGGVFLGITFERLLQATGRSMYSMVSQLAGALTNIILDPIFIFGLLGVPKMGVAGAAWATIIGQFVGMVVGLWANVSRNKEITINVRGFRPNPTTIRHIYQVGLPSIVMQSIGSVMTFGINKILIGFGTTAVSVFSVYFKLQSFIFMPVFGLNSGMVPIVAFNYGARKKDRIQETVRLTTIVSFCIMLTGTVIFWVLPRVLLSFFNANEATMLIGVPSLRIISLAYPIAGICITFSGVFQALGQGMYSLWMSITRQLVVLLPAAWILAKFWGLPAMWFAFPIAEIACLVLTIWLFRRFWRQKISVLQ